MRKVGSSAHKVGGPTTLLEDSLYQFRTPSFEMKPVNGGRLLSRYRLNYGQSVVKYGSQYELVVTPSIDVWNTADEVYLGGRVYEISNEEAALLTAAGFGQYLTEV